MVYNQSDECIDRGARQGVAEMKAATATLAMAATTALHHTRHQHPPLPPPSCCRFVPPTYQVLFANVVALVWNVYFSFATRPKTA